MSAVDLRLGDLVRLRRRHPCGSHEWRVGRLGADIGLTCAGCARRILMDRLEVERRFIGHVERGPEVEA